MSGRQARARRKKNAVRPAASTRSKPREAPDSDRTPAAGEREGLAAHEASVQPATLAVQRLYDEMDGDLDLENGGFVWWHGYTDAKRVTLISEYMMASLQGVGSGLLAASLQVEIHRQRVTADTHWIQTQWSALSKQVARPEADDFIRVIRRGPRERVRAAEMGQAAEHAFYHLAQVLDRLAACLIGVAGLKADIVGAAWSTVERAVRSMGTTSTKILYELDMPGRQAQENLLTGVMRQASRGPSDWLPWLLRQRHTLAHRAPKMEWSLLARDRRGGTKLVTPFPAQPGWSDVEAFVRNNPAEGLADMLLMEDPHETLVEFLKQTTELSVVLLNELLCLWRMRRSDTRLIIQPGEQWPAVMGAVALEFDGFGVAAIDVVDGPGSAMYIAPQHGRRFRASKVMDDASGFWSD